MAARPEVSERLKSAYLARKQEIEQRRQQEEAAKKIEAERTKLLEQKALERRKREVARSMAKSKSMKGAGSTKLKQMTASSSKNLGSLASVSHSEMMASSITGSNSSLNTNNEITEGAFFDDSILLTEE
jgi:uncharacterized protein YaiL (DUF2058 family)